MLLGDAPLCPMFPPTMLCQLCTSLLIVAGSRRNTLMALILESDGHVTLQPLQSRDVATFCISITFSPFFIFFIILLFQLQFLVYRHASHLSRALSFSFRIPCCYERLSLLTPINFFPISARRMTTLYPIPTLNPYLYYS